ncbi:MAG: hypothetical protein U0175_02590 [Caldilineaceae bacterium]
MMNYRINIRQTLLAVCFIGIILLTGRQPFTAIYAQERASADSPLPTPTREVTNYAQKALAYLVEKHGIPIEHLLIEYEVETGYPLSGRTFRHFVISNTHDPDWTTYSLAVETTTGSIEEDITAIERVERDAYQAKYGKMEVSLYDRLQKLADDTTLPIAIWVAGKPKYTEEKILSILASEFPAAAKAIAAATKPTDVDDLEAAAKIQSRYEELVKENLEMRLQPIDNWLSQEGYVYERIDGMPSIMTTLPKSAIQKLARMDGVGLLYLVEAKPVPGLNIASASDRVPTVWQRGYTGTGTRVAVLDVNRINSPCLSIIATKNPGLPLADHATKVANIAACNGDP